MEAAFYTSHELEKSRFHYYPHNCPHTEKPYRRKAMPPLGIKCTCLAASKIQLNAAKRKHHQNGLESNVGETSRTKAANNLV